MYSEKENRIIQSLIRQEINRIEEKFDKIELINEYNSPKIDFGYAEKQYLRELKALHEKLLSSSTELLTA